MFGKTNLLGKLYKSPKKRGKKMDAIFNEWETDPLREMMFKEVAKEDDDFFKGMTKDITPVFKDVLKYRIRRKANTLMALEAPPGEGKSLAALWVDTMWIRSIKEELGIDVGVEFAFNSAQTRNKLASMPDAWICQKDEDTGMEGTGTKSAEIEETNFAETMRFTRKSLIICAPHIALLSGMTLLLRVMAIRTTDDPTQYQSRLLVYQLKENQPGKTPSFLCLGYVIASIGEVDPRLIKEYEAAKAANFRTLEKMGGGVSAIGPEDLKQIKKWAKKVYALAIKDGWPDNPKQPSKKALKTFIWKLNLALTTEKDDALRDEVISLYRKDQAKKLAQPIDDLATQLGLPQPALPLGTDPATPSLPPVPVSQQLFFNPNEDDVLADLKREDPLNPDIDRNIAIYKAAQDPLKTGEDMANLYHISPERVRQLRLIMRGKIAEKLGNKYEDFLDPYLKQKYVTVIHEKDLAKRGGKPDFICIDAAGRYFIYSVKCYRITLTRGTYSIKWTESHAEIECARTLYRTQNISPTVITHLFDLNSQKIWEFTITDPNVITTSVPYSNRNFMVKKGDYTRDPAIGSWV